MDTSQQFYIDILNRIPIEKISDHPNILVAAGFWDEERYHAAKTCYAFMRKIDDLIDDYKARHQGIGEKEKAMFLRKAEGWLSMVQSPRRNSPFQKELISVIRKFNIPLWPMENFARSMVYDINNNGFPTIGSFIDYSEGATVSPSAIFVHLCGIRNKDGIWHDPLFNVREISRPCAIFSYLVHIIRDFQKDQMNNLSYFADDRITANGLTRSGMRLIAEGAPIPEGFRNLMKEYYDLADDYRKQTWQVLDQLKGLVEPRYYLSLLIIFNLYLMVFERINIEKGLFTASELNPGSREIYDRVYRTISNFNAVLV